MPFVVATHLHSPLVIKKACALRVELRKIKFRYLSNFMTEDQKLAKKYDGMFTYTSRGTVLITKDKQTVELTQSDIFVLGSFLAGVYQELSNPNSKHWIIPPNRKN